MGVHVRAKEICPQTKMAVRGKGILMLAGDSIEMSHAMQAEILNINAAIVGRTHILFWTAPN